MVQRTEVVRSAERKARQMVEQAESQARRRRHEVDDYCEERLEQFASALKNVQSAVADARGRLQPTVPVREPESSIEPEDPSTPEVFDQDEI